MKMKILEVRLSTGVITPDAMPAIIETARRKLPAGGTEGVVISGRMPMWLAAALVHLYHPRPWVATFDPRLGGGVVVATHTPGMKVGQVIPVVDDETVTVEFPGGAH